MEGACCRDEGSTVELFHLVRSPLVMSMDDARTLEEEYGLALAQDEHQGALVYEIEKGEDENVRCLLGT